MDSLEDSRRLLAGRWARERSRNRGKLRAVAVTTTCTPNFWSLSGNCGRAAIGQIANQPADRLLASADLVITVGYNPIEFWPALWNAGKDRKIIHIDVRELDLDVEYCPYVELTGDIAQTLATLTPMVNRASMSALSEQMLRSIALERTRLAEEAAGKDGTPIHPIRLVAELQKVLDTDVTLCLDMGSFHLWIARHLYSFRARQVLISNGQQTLGVALPWGIAASLVRPREKVISISGDGGFLFSAMELETAVRLKCNWSTWSGSMEHMTWSRFRRSQNTVVPPGASSDRSIR